MAAQQSAALNNGVGYTGFQQPDSSGSDFNAHTFLVWSILANVRTMQVCQVMSVTNDGGISPVGFVSLQPMVNQVDGTGNAEPHGTIYNVPYFRLQGGANAIILDPQEGDIGWAGFADRDISSVKATKAQANPGSSRQFDMADAVYFGGILNGTPNQYIAFSASGIAITSPNNVSITVGGNLSATVAGTTTINSTGDATIQTDGNATITAVGDIDFSGANGTMSTSGGNMSVTATGALTVSGQTINLNP
jgi:hypothetical protein